MPNQLTDTDRLIAKAQAGSSQARASLLESLRPQVYRIACQVCRRRLEWENDDELSVALEGLDEAITSYSPEGGAGFHGFARAVIKRRLVDHFRRERRHRERTVPMDLQNPEMRTMEFGLALETYEAESRRQELASDLMTFRGELEKLGISLEEVALASPSHRDTRDRLKKVARELAGDPDLMSHLRLKKGLPQKELSRRLGISARVLTRGRAYVMALALLLTMEEDVPHLWGYLDLEPEER